MRSIKPGRGSSLSGAIGGIAAALFGCIWTAIAFSMTNDMNSMGMGLSAMNLFPYFGVIFIIMGLVIAGVNLYNVFSKKRMSMLDITDSREEPDPLNMAFGVRNAQRAARTGIKAEFCPYCGNRVEGTFEFCPFCGEKLFL